MPSRTLFFQALFGFFHLLRWGAVILRSCACPYAFCAFLGVPFFVWGAVRFFYACVFTGRCLLFSTNELIQKIFLSIMLYIFRH
jgi:hypothetical protein